MRQFTDQSMASRHEKARRFLKSLASPTDHRYFYGDGYPRQDELMQDAAAALEVFESLPLESTGDPHE